MARDLPTIQAALNDAQAAQPALAPLNSPSQTAIYTLWKYIIALCQLLLEQLWDIKQAEIESIVLTAPVGSEPWLQEKMFEFQYDSVVPQLLQVVNFAPAYNPIDITKLIITRCAVITGTNGNVLVKVAKQNPPVPLATLELAAAQAYLTGGGTGTYAGRGRGLGFAGINYNVTSFPGDFLYIAGTIYYNGQYSATVQADVIAAINTYMLNIPFNGNVSILALTDAIQSVPEVNDIKLTDVGVRAYSVAFGSRTSLIQSSTQLLTSYPAFSGYVVPEVSPNDLASVLVFTPS